MILKVKSCWLPEKYQYMNLGLVLKFTVIIHNCIYLCIFFYYIHIAVSYKDWELPNSQIWLGETDIESGLDFPI